jgi:hypothetical protein
MEVSAAIKPRPAVMTKIPSLWTGGRTNFRAYVIFPRKYRPLKKLNTSASVAPCAVRSDTASSKAARSLKRICARRPEQLAGDNKKIRCKTYLLESLNRYATASMF